MLRSAPAARWSLWCLPPPPDMSTSCSMCGAENREGRRFCAQCGGTLAAATCPTCRAANDPGERFCGECGGPLAVMAPSSRSTASRAETVGGEGERKQLTVLFTDVLGSMDVQEHVDAEDWARIMGRFVDIVAEEVRRFGGTVDKFTGDGIMALFGAPFAQDDHARRACRAAWHITRVIAAYAGELRRDQDINLEVRVGLNSGEVVVGRVGDGVTLDSTALGHAVGLAQRMEAMAAPGRAYLTEHTARLVDGWFGLEDLGPKKVKGARHPLSVYVLGPPFPSPPTVRGAATLGASRLVGREPELAALEDALAEAIEGRCQVVGVVGEAGMGKSRLCEEFISSATARGITVRRTTGVSHGRAVALLPILSLLRDYFSITDTDTAPKARDNVTARLLALDPGLDHILPLIFDFLEVPDPERPAPELAAEVRMRRILDAIHRITARRSEREVLVLLVEDLHWFDPQSDAFLERLIESFPGSRTLVVTNFRPEFSARWMRHSYYRQLPLAPLRDEAVGDLLGGLVGSRPSLAPLRGFVLEYTGGNPFFVEEMVRALVEDGTLSGRPGNYELTRPLTQVRVPPTIQATLAARIDRLSAEHKATLQAAAVIGRAFSVTVLAGVTDSTDDALDDAVRALCGAELLQETAGGPVGDYRFWHPLTQEVAYDSLLTGRRERLHTAVAETLATDEQRAGERAGVIAWHWERAGRPVEAARWNFEAGSWALRSDLGEAQRRWRAIDLLEGVPETDESLNVGILARAKLCQFGARTGMAPDEAERLYTEARGRAEQLGDPKLLALVVAASGSNKLWTGDPRGGLDRYLEGAQMADQTGDRDLQSTIWLGPPQPLVHVGPLGEGIAWTDRQLALCADDPDRGVGWLGFSPLTKTLDNRARLLLLAGRLPEAAQDIDRAVALGRRRAEPDPLGWALTLAGRLAWLSGEGEGLASAAEAVRIGEDTGNIAGLVLGLESQALSELAAGRPSRAVAACQRALREMRAHQSGRFEEGPVLAHLARARLAAGDPAEAVDAAIDAVTVAVRQRAKVVECLALLTRAQMLRATHGDIDDISADLDAALALVSETGALTYEPFIREEYARLRADPAEMKQALRLYTAIGASGHARRLRTELDVPTQHGG
jgi:class 3 adenylate cyclase/tetratricopeptide (TPR) repeat protein